MLFVNPLHRQQQVFSLFLLVITLSCAELLYNLNLLLNDRLLIHLVVFPLFGQCYINNNLMHFHPKMFTFQRKRRRKRTNKGMYGTDLLGVCIEQICWTAGKKLISLIALALNLDEDFFEKDGAFNPPMPFLRLLHYPG
ncbi:uncharacterized protein LOC114292481 isoform X2 [Camellia sinensis]|uniref:uncharacterized protein LOC114292481 isoform X2 n=1 Tax=Camellia sinensis TaxID=4442 RepID=UPI001036B9E3|nr:uncharacterized protein LOC114292481 isoform X2 [Camellia sinensis]